VPEIVQASRSGELAAPIRIWRNSSLPSSSSMAMEPNREMNCGIMP